MQSRIILDSLKFQLTIERLCHQSISDFTSETFEIGGAQPLTMREFVEALMAAIDIKKSFVEIPGPIASAFWMLLFTATIFVITKNHCLQKKRTSIL